MVRPLTSIKTPETPIARRLPLRPAAHAESSLVNGILNGTFPFGSELPSERALAEDLGVTRPTLREALKRLERDGWISIQHGKTTLVRDVYQDGGLNILEALVRHEDALPEGFIEQLLEVRSVMAPAYTRAAVERLPDRVAGFLEPLATLAEDPEKYAAFDWHLHASLTLASGNLVYRLILNGFAGFYEDMARLYFATPEARQFSLRFYEKLLAASRAGDAENAETVTRETMKKSLELWRGRKDARR